MIYRLKRIAVSAGLIGYCGLGWILMEEDYFTRGLENSTIQQAIHLGLTGLLVLGVILWKGHALERGIARLSALPAREAIAPFVATFGVFLTMVSYPRSQAVLNGIAWGLMESTRPFVQQMFLTGALVGIAVLMVLCLETFVRGLSLKVQRVVFGSRRNRFLATSALLVFLATNAVSSFQFRHLPILPEEVGYLFQARIFSDGGIYAEAPLLAEFFAFGNIIMSDKWFLPAPPGFPLLLAVGLLVGAPWIVNPIFAAASCVLLFLCARKMYGEDIARGSAILMILSPFILFLLSLYLPYSPLIFFHLLGVYLLTKGVEGGIRSSFFLSGLSFGGGVLIDPLITFAVVFPWILYLAVFFWRRRTGLSCAGALMIGVVLALCLFYLYGFAVGRNWPVFDPSFGSGYHAGFFAFPFMDSIRETAQRLLYGMVNLNNRLHYVGIYLLGWPVFSLIFAAVPFALALKNRWDYLLLGSVLSLCLVFLFFFHENSAFGPRYYCAAGPFLLILVARGIDVAPSLWSRLTGREDLDLSRLFLSILIFLCIAFNLGYFLPSRLRLYNVSSLIHKQLPSPLQQHVEAARADNAIVFINDFPFRMAYGAGFWLNEPSLAGNVIYARDLGEDNQLLMQQYPGRKYYLYTAMSDSFQEMVLVRNFRAASTASP
ncbi:MAG: hypothetical protein C4520_15630 [Candidatus Abyssobacteria bacterium SURF_5]|uniref:Glycosyltransferase RgtA/B/C/D-like domain-containing protein n=1 Tax=Abyssobacteria bacterium (strain SURF_5) TaxID=2093360 RepID=A0A3A4NE23_ABYX5|nr:MAG: hypothetical protein C4520_15630 [Candidatus Abyssubacteria bacterium SURF_5]